MRIKITMCHIPGLQVENVQHATISAKLWHRLRNLLAGYCDDERPCIPMKVTEPVSVWFVDVLCAVSCAVWVSNDVHHANCYIPTKSLTPSPSQSLSRSMS